MPILNFVNPFETLEQWYLPLAVLLKTKCGHMYTTHGNIYLLVVTVLLISPRLLFTLELRLEDPPEATYSVANTTQLKGL